MKRSAGFTRLLKGEKMSHYFTNDEVKSKEKEITIIVKNEKLTLVTDNGVFSKKGLDFGTRTLLETVSDCF